MGSQTQAAHCAATTASKALPPSLRTSAAAAAVTGWPQATAPNRLLTPVGAVVTVGNAPRGYRKRGLEIQDQTQAIFNLPEQSVRYPTDAFGQEVNVHGDELRHVDN